jgi:tetratricopeptide (TPR) repeat protein
LAVLNEVTSNVFKASVSPLVEASDRLEQTDYFVHGVINTDQSKITIDVELFDREEVKLWSESYSNNLDSLSGLAGQIALDISETLKVKLAVGESRRISELEPMETEQYELWLKASNQLSKWTPEGFANARIYLDEMVDNNPASTRSWAMYAQGLIKMGHSGFPPPGVWKEAKAGAERALQIDSLNADAWAALACTKTYGEQDFDGAVEAYDRANALNPNLAMNHYHYAWHLYLYDQLDEAIVEHTIAQELDPLKPGHTYWLAFLLVENGEFECAMEEAQRLLRITSDSSGIYRIAKQIYLKQERYDSALYFAEKANDKFDVVTCKVKMGDIDPIMEFIQSIEEMPLNSWRAFQLAGLYAEIDSLDRFFEYANYEPPSYATPYFRKLITNTNVFRDPRFNELMAKFDLPMPKGYE